MPVKPSETALIRCDNQCRFRDPEDTGLLYQRTIPDSVLGWARRRPDQREAEEGDPGEGGRDNENLIPP